MSDHIPDAGKKVCPFCGAEKTTIGTVGETYACYSFNLDDSRNPKMTIQSNTCVTRERDQLRAKVEQLEGWCERMANMLEEEGWESTAQNEFRKYMETKPKPEGL